jgi:hypothetical protein
MMDRIGWCSLATVLALAAASCGGSDADHSTVATSPGPTGSSGPSATDRAPGRSPDASRQPPAGGRREFDRSAVRISFVDTSYPFGSKSQVVYFVANGSASRALAQAKECARQNATKTRSAYCFAFASERALRFSRISRRPPAKMQRPCWSAYWGQPKGRRGFGASSNPAAAALHCPDARG